MNSTKRRFRNGLLGFAVAIAIACGVWWVVRQCWYAEVVLISAKEAVASLTIDGKPVSPSAVRDSGDVTYSTYHPPVGTRRFVVSDAKGVLLDTQTELEPQSVTTYVLFCASGRWLAERSIEYGGAPRPDFSAFDPGPQAMDGRVVDVDGKDTSFLTRTDDVAGRRVLKSLGTRVHTPARLLDYRSRALLWPWERVPDSVIVEGGMETLTQICVLNLDDVAVAQRLRTAAIEDERRRAAALDAAEGNSGPRP